MEISDDLQRSEVFRSQDDVLTAGETWKAAMIDRGWADSEPPRRRWCFERPGEQPVGLRVDAKHELMLARVNPYFR